jgi:hypothetical protein
MFGLYSVDEWFTGRGGGDIDYFGRDDEVGIVELGC